MILGLDIVSRNVRSNTVYLWKTAVIIYNGNGKYFLNKELLSSKFKVNMEHFINILILRKPARDYLKELSFFSFL